MMISPWRSAKWPGETRQPLDAAETAPAIVEQQRDHPEQPRCAVPSEVPADDEQPGPITAVAAKR